MTWHEHAARLAASVTSRGSRWREPVTTTPRHLFVPRWWDTPTGASFGTWQLRDGLADEQEWLATGYRDESLITQVAGVHADHATPGQVLAGRPTSSSTLPGLVVRMLRHGEIYDGADVLDLATGSGYSAALLSRSLGDAHVTSIDVDLYLTEAAAERLDRVGLHPKVVTCDGNGPLPGRYDRIVSMVAVRPIPASWLEALRPGGRLVTCIANTSLIVTANKTDDGWARGQIERDWAMFMPTRSGSGAYGSGLADMYEAIRDQSGEDVGQGRYPVVDVGAGWELRSMLEVMAPGVEDRYEQGEDGRRTAWLLHEDGSWARASAQGMDCPTVHQAGPRRLWDIFDDIRFHWLASGSLPLYGARVSITPSGVIRVWRGTWKGVIR
ncbi:methyltransferase domain-containing protein [Nonomuraea sp. NEAU-A123]|uniref:methyltransferase domain-containing protein n=1 Tax=Nonomuraea sp. NEAU-A123 TaxID=2839649 RepID=UPI001BE46539|nr:methyltransferase domain-containing protein [Nonomuraea sp. NEAU-A123]MBT2228842.1 methyltransferase [Nonomuraea sp. NEAU-A123]